MPVLDQAAMSALPPITDINACVSSFGVTVGVTDGLGSRLNLGVKCRETIQSGCSTPCLMTDIRGWLSAPGG
jgi:hypothetical protein